MAAVNEDGEVMGVWWVGERVGSGIVVNSSASGLLYSGVRGILSKHGEAGRSSSLGSENTWAGVRRPYVIVPDATRELQPRHAPHSTHLIFFDLIS